MEDIFIKAFLKVLNMSMTASYIILAVLIARALLRGAPKKYSYALWLAAAFRLVCPVSFKSVISIFSLKPFNVPIKDSVLTEQGAEIVHIPENIGLMDYPEINTGIEALDPVVNGSLPAATPMWSANPMQIWEFFGMLLWVSGIVVLLVVSLVSLLRLCRRLRTATVLEGNVWQSEAAQSPFIIGLFRPKIYIPYGLEGRALTHVLAHERAHIRRGDHIVRTLAYLVLCLHWFNPLVWLAFYLMGRDMELSCDEKVLAKLGDRAEYSETLLSFASPRRFPAPTPLAFGESSVGRRIKNALSWRKPRLWISITALVLCAAVITVCAANPRTEDDGWFLAGRWVSVECVYNDGLSSVFPYGDNDRVYDIHAEGDGVRVFDRRSGGFLGGFGIREWQDFPYSDEEWEDMFLAYDMAFSAPLSELYDEILYMGPNPNLDMLPLHSEEEHEAFIEPTDFFMAVDGELRYVSTRKDAQGKLWVSRIDVLQKEENIDNTEPADAAAADIPAGSPWELLTGLEFENVSSIMLDGDVAAADREQLNTVALEVLQLLKNVAGNEVYAGRGAPNRYYLSLGFDEGRSGIRLGFCGDFVELQFRGEVEELYPADRGVWEIHNEALTEFLAEITAVDGDYGIFGGKAEDVTGMELLMPTRTVVLGEELVGIALELLLQGESNTEVYVIDGETSGNINHALKVNYTDGSSDLLYIDTLSDSFNRYTQSNDSNGNFLRVSVACPELWKLLKEQAGIVEREDLPMVSIGFEISDAIKGDTLEVKLGPGDAADYSISASVGLEARDGKEQNREYAVNFSKESLGEAMGYDFIRVGFFLDGNELYSRVFPADEILGGYLECGLRSDGVFTIYSQGPNTVSFAYDPEKNRSVQLDFGEYDCLELTYDGGDMLFTSDGVGWGEFIGNRAFFDNEDIYWTPMEPVDDENVLAKRADSAVVVFGLSKDGTTYGGALSIEGEDGAYTIRAQGEWPNLGLGSDGRVVVVCD